jgi:hypothetical protein
MCCAVQVQEELGGLKLKVKLGYKGLSDSQVDELLAQEAKPVLQDRRAAAQALLQCADTFLRRQAAEWQLAVRVLSSWLSSVMALYESHKSSTAAAETGIKAALRSAVEQFESEDAAREATVATAVQLLSQGSDEKELDARLETALQALSAVQAGYRAHHSSAVSTVRAYPGQCKNSSDMYIKCLSGLLHVQQHQQQEATKSAGEHHAVAASVAGSVAGAAVPAAPASPAADGATTQEQSSQPVHGQVQLTTGGLYDQLHDLWQGLMNATPKPWLAQYSHMQDSHREGHLALAPATAAAATAAAASAAAAIAAVSQAPAASAASPSISGSEGKTVAPPSKLTKQQLAEAAAAEEAARAAEAAAAAAAAEAAAYAAAVAQPPSPISSGAGALCLTLLTPDEIVSVGLLQLQVGMQPCGMISSCCVRQATPVELPVVLHPCKSACTALDC